MRRRTFLTAAPLVAPLALIPPATYGQVAGIQEASQSDGAGSPNQAIQSFLNLPGQTSFLIQAGLQGSLGQIEHNPALTLFTASAFKTFVLGAYLRAVETGLLDEDAQLPVDDSVRDFGSPVLLNLAGTMPARPVLEAMIAHSDNTATNLAMLNVGVRRVRAIIAQAGLSRIIIPDSVRIFESYLFGAPPGTDLGWPGIVQAAEHPGPVHPLLNDVITLAGTARDFVAWYDQALHGDFFNRAETLVEFKRIQSMSDNIPKAVPANTVAYAKSGEAPNVAGSNAKSLAGQMVVATGRRDIPVSFCFIANWQTSVHDYRTVEAAFLVAVRAILTGIKAGLVQQYA